MKLTVHEHHLEIETETPQDVAYLERLGYRPDGPPGGNLAIVCRRSSLSGRHFSFDITASDHPVVRARIATPAPSPAIVGGYTFTCHSCGAQAEQAFRVELPTGPSSASWIRAQYCGQLQLPDGWQFAGDFLLCPKHKVLWER